MGFRAKNRLLALAAGWSAAALVMGCGEDSQSDKDPEKTSTISESNTSEHDPSSGGEGGGSVDTETGKTSTDGNGLCLNDCTVSTEGVYKVVASARLTSPDCETTNYAMAAISSGLVVTQDLRCKNADQNGIYLQEIGASASSLGNANAVKLTGLCSQSESVAALHIEAVLQRYFVLAICQDAMLRWRSVLHIQDSKTGPVSTLSFHSGSRSEDISGFAISYNERFATLGVVGPDRMWRFDAAGTLLAAPTIIDSQTLPVAALLKTSEGWVTIRGKASDDKYCSKVDAFGVLRCDRKKLGRENAYYTPSGTLLAVTYYGSLEESSFAISQCERGSEEREVGDLGPIRMYVDPIAGAQAGETETLILAKASNDSSGFLTSIRRRDNTYSVTSNPLDVQKGARLLFHDTLNLPFSLIRNNGALSLNMHKRP